MRDVHFGRSNARSSRPTTPAEEFQLVTGPSAPTGIVARGLTMKTPQGVVFGPLDWDVPPRRPAAIVGEQGSGRSALLLALAGRVRGVSGELRVGDIDGIAKPGRLRKATAVARISDLVELEPALTVASSIDEHALMEGLSVRKGRRAFAAVEEASGIVIDRKTRVDELTALQRTELAVLLACVRPSAYVVLDDADASLTPPQLDELYAATHRLEQLDRYLIVSVLGGSAVPAGASTLTLATQPTPESLRLHFARLQERRTGKES